LNDTLINLKLQSHTFKQTYKMKINSVVLK